VCSSRLDRDTGIVTVTTPGAGYTVGMSFYVLGSATTWGIDHIEWALRLLRPQAPPQGRAWSVGVDTAEAELALAVRYGLVHESLVAEPPAANAA
jgi:hypothetical protein